MTSQLTNPNQCLIQFNILNHKVIEHNYRGLMRVLPSKLKRNILIYSSFVSENACCPQTSDLK